LTENNFAAYERTTDELVEKPDKKALVLSATKSHYQTIKGFHRRGNTTQAME